MKGLAPAVAASSARRPRHRADSASQSPLRRKKCESRHLGSSSGSAEKPNANCRRSTIAASSRREDVADFEDAQRRIVPGKIFDQAGSERLAQKALLLGERIADFDGVRRRR